MPKRATRDSSLNSAAENIGTALGHVAARLDRWKKDQATLRAAWERRKASATVQPMALPMDQRGAIRSKAART